MANFGLDRIYRLQFAHQVFDYLQGENPTTTMPAKTISVTPTPTWVPLKIEGSIPDPYYTPKFGLKVIPIHPTFACELEGVDWGKDIPPELYKEIREVVDQVRHPACDEDGPG